MADSYNDPTREEMLDFIEQNFKTALQEIGDEDAWFYIEAALYWYCSEYHHGQRSNLYSCLSNSSYKPSPLEYGVEDTDELTREIYTALEEQF